MATTIGTETGVALPRADMGKSQAAAGLRSIVLPLGLAFVVLAAWQLYVTVWNVPAVILPSPISIAKYIVARYDILLTHAVPTTLESAAGFLLALVLGVGAQSRIAFSVFIAFFPVVIATTAGFLSVDRGMLRLCRSLTATEWQVFTSVRFPSALPHIFSGMKIAVTLAIIGVIIGEFITAQAGLGYLIIFATARADTEVSMAAIVVLCICGLLLYGLVALAESVANRFYSADSR